VRFVRVDAFTDRVFAGNPACVVLPPGPAETAWMQAVAREMNQPATAFAWAEDGAFALRWFSPTVELQLCGHGTLAAAHALWETGALAAGATARFRTASGPLGATRTGDWIELDLPAEPAVAAEPPPGLLEALGVVARAVARNRLDYLVEVADESTVRALAPDLARLRSVPTRGVIVTSLAASPHDFVSRFFAPRAGIDEDAVTGSAHCCLGPYWSARLGRRELRGFQASARGGVVRVGVEGERVRLAGQAVTVARGEFT
jgi:predicted PhzF superfamily epimerase YddE/YHI9